MLSANAGNSWHVAYVLFVFCMAIVSTSSSAIAQIPSAYDIQIIDISVLNPPAGNPQIPKGINNAGQVLFGEKSGVKGVWDPSGVVYPLPVNTADAINNHGWVVGHGPQTIVDQGIKDNAVAAVYNIYTDTLIEVPTWLDDRPDLIPNAGSIDQYDDDVETKFYGVNDLGIAVGRTKNGEDPRWQPFSYDINSGEYYPFKRTVPVGDSGSRQAYPDIDGNHAINNNNVALGDEELRSNTGLDVVVWNAANADYADMEIVQLPDGTGIVPGPGESNGQSIALNDNNTVLMRTTGGTTDYVLVDFDPSTNGVAFRTEIPLRSGYLASDHFFHDMTDSEVLLGETGTSTPSGYETENILWTDSTGYVPVQSLLSSTWSGWTITEAFWMNDNHQLVAQALDPLGQSHTVLLNPVPEPASGLLLLSAFSSLVLGQRLGRKSKPANNRHPDFA
ncbi:hypothetical protein Mal64_06620 [Pseudobythopirellula maris]|uniref:PEP-CTERM protein-sorting domain-containing protein n=1 Tax=Pseudobythopirellula maris TaxID=2527991 RepID=A0A5C5ZTA2_9BACT|nr:hypothetical protein [Pseudobythopirellula maris]TWT90277.1 hypothetical protein Mal64_06620 [Pseudobythopirellula maris]